MKTTTLATILAAALLLFVPSVNAQPVSPCTGTPTSLDALTGGWSYYAELVSSQPIPGSPNPYSFVAAGTFNAKPGTDRRGNPTGVINAVQSSQINGNPVRLEQDYGASSYQGNNCGGVTISFTFSTRPIDLDCWFQAGRTILYCVSGTTEFPVILHASRLELVL